MRAGEFEFAVHPKGVIPHDPAARLKTNFLGRNFQLGRIFIADRQPECAIRLESPVDSSDPRFAPGQVLLAFFGIGIDVVRIANVEGRIGKCQIDRSCRLLSQTRDAVFQQQLIQWRLLQSHIDRATKRPDGFEQMPIVAAGGEKINKPRHCTFNHFWRVG